MITTDFSTKELTENDEFIEWNFEPQPFMADEVFETIGRIFAPIYGNMNELPC
jgi:hypothetical protein